MAEKSEKATPKKLRDARKKGQVAKSQDFPSAFTFIVSISCILAFSSMIYKNLSSYLIIMFKSISMHGSLQERAGGILASALQMIFSTSIPLMVLVSMVGVLVNFLIIGPLFAMEAMKPDIKRLNPVTNIKNIFKVKTVIELLKSIFKITGAVVLIYSVIYDRIDQIAATSAMPLIMSTVVFSSFLKQVVLRVGIFFIVVGIIDLVFQRKNFAKEMKMEKFEVKQEYKDTEGDPQLKSKRRQAAQEIAYQEGPGAAKRAKAVVTNPTHIAVAVEYDAEEEPAPKILTMGQDLVAEEIVKVALANNVPIMRNIELAHSLYFKGTAGNFIPEETYEAMAEVLKWIAGLEEEAEGELEEGMDIFNQ